MSMFELPAGDCWVSPARCDKCILCLSTGRLDARNHGLINIDYPAKAFGLGFRLKFRV